MADDLYGFTGHDVDRIRRLLEAFEGGSRLKGAETLRGAGAVAKIETYFGRTTEAISARSVTLTTLTALNGAINSSVTSITVDSTALFPTLVDSFVIVIDSEAMLVSSFGSSTATVTRGINGTTAASHLDNADVQRERVTLGEGDVDLYKAVEQPTGFYDVENSFNTETAYNACDAIDAGMFVHLFREAFSGILMIVPMCADMEIGPDDAACPCDEFCYFVAFPSFTDWGGDLPGPMEMEAGVELTSGAPCFWGKGWTGPQWSGNPDDPGYSYGLSLSLFDGIWYLALNRFAFGTILYWTADGTGWDCTSPLEFTLQSLVDPPNVPITVTLVVCSEGSGSGSGGVDAPTVDVNTDLICLDAATITITGTNFTSPASSNSVTLTDSAANTIIFTFVSGTSTSLVLGLTGIAAAGEVDCVITNANGSSGAAVQVADAVDCDGGCTWATMVWHDTFTDANGTNITAHTPDASPGGAGYTDLDPGGNHFRIQTSKLGETFDGTATHAPTVSFDPGEVVSKASINFVWSSTTNIFEVVLSPRFNGTPATTLVSVLSGNNPSGTSAFLSIGTLDNGDFDDIVTLVDGNTYTLTVINLANLISVTLNGVTVTAPTTADNTQTKWFLEAFTYTAVNDSISMDELKVWSCT